MLRSRTIIYPVVYSLKRGRGLIGLTAARFSSSAGACLAPEDSDDEAKASNSELHRLLRIRNVGIFAHVDAGKTTVTERMLELAGIVKNAGSVDDGNTVTDYLPAERERGITIQSAAISFEWEWHNNKRGDDLKANDNVTVSLIDTPGHVDFSVEVNRSVAVLDGAVLVVDAVSGVQAQTETVWRAMTRPSLNNHDTAASNHAHEPLPCIALVNKMDKEGCNFGSALQSLRQKLPGANPIAIQLPLFRSTLKASRASVLTENIVAVNVNDSPSAGVGDFAGVVDLIHMRAIVWPEQARNEVEKFAPKVVPLLKNGRVVSEDCQLTMESIKARQELIESLAEHDEAIEGYYLNEQDPSNAEIRMALRRTTLAQKSLPVLASAALRGRGIEPVLDAVADLLPSPIDRLPPALLPVETDRGDIQGAPATTTKKKIVPGHPLHPSLLALAFKVVHMKGRGGSGDGRVVFARVYSGELRDRETVQVISPPMLGEEPQQPRKERVGGMLELAGGRFGNLRDGICRSGDVCALLNLKSVVTGDTIVMAPTSRSKHLKDVAPLMRMAGVSSPKPVLTVKLEAETTAEQARLIDALELLSVEDPSLVVEEVDSVTLLSGLGELHVEIALDRIKREFGIRVMVGSPSVSYRETVSAPIGTNGMVTYDKTLGEKRFEASLSLTLEPLETEPTSSCMVLSDPVVTIGPAARSFLQVSETAHEDDLVLKSPVVKALVEGCRWALKRGAIGPYPAANLECHVIEITAENGLSGLEALPGSLRAAADHAIATLLTDNRSSCTVLEPSMSVEVTVPNDLVGSVLADLTRRRGTIDDIIAGEEDGTVSKKTLLRGDVPLVEILGYAGDLRSLTGGEGEFTAEYKGHSPASS